RDRHPPPPRARPAPLRAAPGGAQAPARVRRGMGAGPVRAATGPGARAGPRDRARRVRPDELHPVPGARRRGQRRGDREPAARGRPGGPRPGGRSEAAVLAVTWGVRPRTAARGDRTGGATMHRPEQIALREVAPRDGLQNEPPVPTGDKIRLVDALSRTGLARIEAVSFVHPRAVPQMADAAEVWAAVEKRPGVRYSALAPNLKGVE